MTRLFSEEQYSKNQKNALYAPPLYLYPFKSVVTWIPLSNIDQSAISRLVNIKGSYEHALLLLENPTPLDGAIALVLMDNVLEATFKLVLDEIGSKVKRDPNFPILLDKVLEVNVLRELKNHRLSLLVLHRARNGFQHHGIIPDLNTVLREYRPLTEYVLKLICRQNLGLRWEDVSLSLLIKDETIKNLHGKAEKAFVQGDYITATAYLIYTFEVVKTVARRHIFGSGLSSHRFKIKLRRNEEKNLIQYITTLDEEIEVFKLGLSYVGLRNYLDVAQFVGINDILYGIPPNMKEEAIIDDFKQKLEKKVAETKLLREWYINIRDFVLKFIIRTETNWRFSLKLIEQLFKGIIEGIDKVFENVSTELKDT